MPAAPRAVAWVALADGAAVAERAAGRVAELARSAIAARGRFCLALSGGATPRALYERLAGDPWRDRVDWARAELFWGDERAVPPDHPDSNYRTAFEALIGPLALDPTRVHRMRGEAGDLDAAAADYEGELARVFGIPHPGSPPAFDLVLLGLGSDGHTASLFPGTAALAETRRWTVANRVPQLGTTRLTLTLPVLNAAREVLFLVAGRDKAAVLAEVRAGADAGGSRFPSQLVQPAGRLAWLFDAAAGAELPRLGAVPGASA